MWHFSYWSERLKEVGNFGQYLFEQFYNKIWHKENIDLLNIFHPLRPDSYNNQSPLVKHPLIKNRILIS